MSIRHVSGDEAVDYGMAAMVGGIGLALIAGALLMVRVLFTPHMWEPDCSWCRCENSAQIPVKAEKADNQ